MIETKGDIWEYHHRQQWVAITTNGFVKSNGHAVMGRGTARQAMEKFPLLPAFLGARIKTSGNHVHCLSRFRLFAFPVKHHWAQDADLELIRRSTKELAQVVTELGVLKVFMPRPGCGNGRLDWNKVRPILFKHFDDRFVIVKYSV